MPPAITSPSAPAFSTTATVVGPREGGVYRSVIHHRCHRKPPSPKDYRGKPPMSWSPNGEEEGRASLPARWSGREGAAAVPLPSLPLDLREGRVPPPGATEGGREWWGERERARALRGDKSEGEKGCMGGGLISSWVVVLWVLPTITCSFSHWFRSNSRCRFLYCIIYVFLYVYVIRASPPSPPPPPLPQEAAIARGKLSRISFLTNSDGRLCGRGYISWIWLWFCAILKDTNSWEHVKISFQIQLCGKLCCARLKFDQQTKTLTPEIKNLDLFRQRDVKHRYKLINFIYLTAPSWKDHVQPIKIRQNLLQDIKKCVISQGHRKNTYLLQGIEKTGN